MKINVKITASKMAGSLCAYTIYRNYLTMKNKLTKIYFMLLNLLVKYIIWEMLFYILN